MTRDKTGTFSLKTTFPNKHYFPINSIFPRQVNDWDGKRKTGRMDRQDFGMEGRQVFVCAW